MVKDQPPNTRSAVWRLAIVVLVSVLALAGARDVLRLAAFPAVEEEDPDYPELFDDVERQLRDYYLDQDRVGPRARTLTEKALVAMEYAIDEVYVENSDPQNPHVVVHVGDKSKVISLAQIVKLDQAVETLKDVTEFVRKNYRGKLSANKIRFYVVNGFLSGLDPHTQVFSPETFRDFSVHIEGEIFGVGMYVGSSKGQLVVRNVLDGTPAKRAGFKRGDRILKIGEESTVNMDVGDAVQKIRGKENSDVVLTVKRKEKEETVTLAIPVTRQRVTIPSVTSKLLMLPPAAESSTQAAPKEEPSKGEPAKDGPKETSEPPSTAKTGPAVAYVHVSNFDKNTVASLREALENLRKENRGDDLAGLILDLRDNSGGLLKQAEEMSDMFLPQGELYSIAQKGDDVRTTSARNQRSEPRYPIIALANEDSASGAEIVVGALQKNQRAVVLGTATFGKGSVQQLHPLRGDWQLKITVSEYLIPGKISIQENGVVPDVHADRVVVTDKLINVFPRRHYGTERDYEDHIVSRFARKEEPRERIKYYLEADENADAEDPDSEDYLPPAESEPEKDKLVQIALEFARSAIDMDWGRQGFRADRFLRERASAIEKIRDGQYEEIVRRLKEKGIDWSEGKNPENPQVELNVEHSTVERPSKDKDDPLKPFLAVKARLTNKGTEPLHRIKAVTQSDFYLYREHEFLFGRVEPGQTVERSVDMAVPYYPYARNDLIKFVVTGADPATILEREHDVVLEPKERPSFAYAATLYEKGKMEPITALTPGMEVVWRLKVINTSKATSRKGVAALRNQTGPQVFLEPPGRVDIVDLGPGAEKDVDFSFRVTPESTLKSYRFKLEIGEFFSGESLVREIEIPAAGEERKLEENGRRFQPPTIQAFASEIRTAASAQKSGGGGADDASVPESNLFVTEHGEVLLNVRITNSQVGFRSWVTTTPMAILERDTDKVFFRASRGVEDLTYQCRVPLKKGSNLITVTARDENELSARKSIVIRRR